jgi:hypothetical protein
MMVGDTYYETRPFYLKPGPNVAFFPLGAEDFKTERSGWEFRARLESAPLISKLTILIYSPSPGRVDLRNLRIVSP